MINKRRCSKRRDNKYKLKILFNDSGNGIHLREVLNSRPENYLLKGSNEGHGGRTGPNFALFIIHHENMLDINNQKDGYPFIEFGANDGTVSMVMYPTITSKRDILMVEMVEERHRLCVNWTRKVTRARRNNERRDFVVGDIPTPVFGDFTGTMGGYKYKLTELPILGFYNNDESRMLGTVQNGLEKNLEDCKNGSVIICLDTMFHNNAHWHQESFETEIPRGEASWLCHCSNEYETKLITIFKYTKREEAQDRIGLTAMIRIHTSYEAFIRDMGLRL